MGEGAVHPVVISLFWVFFVTAGPVIMPTSQGRLATASSPSQAAEG